MRAKLNTAGQDELKLSITPLIDVTFLLLIFFMCAMRFKTLERKVQAWLPLDHGIVHTKPDWDQETKIKVLLKRGPGEASTRVKLLDRELGAGESAFAELDRRIASIHASNPDLKGEIDAFEEVPHGHVIRSIDSFMKAGVEEIEFRGAPEKKAARRP
jgi:biopolymer transport protein ExbD